MPPFQNYLLCFGLSLYDPGLLPRPTYAEVLVLYKKKDKKPTQTVSAVDGQLLYFLLLFVIFCIFFQLLVSPNI